MCVINELHLHGGVTTALRHHVLQGGASVGFHDKYVGASDGEATCGSGGTRMGKIGRNRVDEAIEEVSSDYHEVLGRGQIC